MEKIKIQISPEQAESFANMLKQIGQKFEQSNLDDGRVEFQFEANPILQEAIKQQAQLAQPKVELEKSAPDEAPGVHIEAGNAQSQARG